MRLFMLTASCVCSVRLMLDSNAHESRMEMQVSSPTKEDKIRRVNTFCEGRV